MERRLPWNLAQLNAIAFLKFKGEAERLDYDYLGTLTCLIVCKSGMALRRNVEILTDHGVPTGKIDG